MPHILLSGWRFGGLLLIVLIRLTTLWFAVALGIIALLMLARNCDNHTS